MRTRVNLLQSVVEKDEAERGHQVFDEDEADEDSLNEEEDVPIEGAPNQDEEAPNQDEEAPNQDEEAPNQDEETPNQNEALNSLKEKLNQHAKLVKDEALKKLLLSSCISLLNKETEANYESILTHDGLQQLVDLCEEERKNFSNRLPSNIIIMINDAFEDLLKFQADTDMDNILDYINAKKSEIKDKKSEKYCLLRTIETMIYGIDKYKKDATLMIETYHLCAFCDIIDPILQILVSII